MLEPNSRRLLMESLQPPDGCRLDWAVGTTYTLDLMALLTAPVAFAFSDWQDRDGRPTCDPLALLKVVRQYASQICLFCQAGKIHVPKTYQPLLASLEESVVEANAPQGGSFHPKMWFLRFVDVEEGTIQYRVLCVSRNMTFDRSWDTLLCLEGPLRDRANAYSKNHPLGQFVESLPGMSVRPMASQWKKRIVQLAQEIRRVEFEIPEPFEDIDFWPLGIGGPARWPFPERLDRLFVVSPFVGDGFIEDLKQSPTQLLSRAESLGRLAPMSLAALEKVWVLNDTANPEPGEAEEEAETDSQLKEDSEDGQEIPLVGLHAGIARQNIQRLNVTGRNDVSHASRITLLPLRLPKMDSRLNFVSFTPGTSFDLKSSGGIAEERALLFWLLREPWSLDSPIASRPFEGWSEPKGFQYWLDRVAVDVSGGRFIRRWQMPLCPR